MEYNFKKEIENQLEDTVSKDNQLKLVNTYCAHHLDEILKKFKKGSKIMLIVRQPDDDTADFVMGNDDMKEIKKVADRCISGFNKNV